MKAAYAIHPGPGENEGRIIVVVEGRRGYNFVEDYDCSPADRRPGIVERLNDRMGISGREADRLVAQSMMEI